MTTDVQIVKTEDLPAGWRFAVRLKDESGEQVHTVELDSDYWQKFAGRYGTPEKLVVESFRFLLNREPRESILLSFNLRKISQYFPEYEEAMKG